MSVATMVVPFRDEFPDFSTHGEPPWALRDVLSLHEGLLKESIEALFDLRTAEAQRDEIVIWMRDPAKRAFGFRTCCMAVAVDADVLRDAVLERFAKFKQILGAIYSAPAGTVTDELREQLAKLSAIVSDPRAVSEASTSTVRIPRILMKRSHQFGLAMEDEGQDVNRGLHASVGDRMVVPDPTPRRREKASAEELALVQGSMF